MRKRDLGSPPLLALVLAAPSSTTSSLRDELFDDFCLTPFHPTEFEARVRHLLWRTGGGARPDMIEYRELMLNLETYQASIGGRPLDLTYMEYELLKFLAQNPGKVFTREMLLSRVWGYEYYGGARTVDVHVRRLRAKLGEEHAGLIQTVRSVGYRFGQSRWERLTSPVAGRDSSQPVIEPTASPTTSANTWRPSSARMDLVVHDPSPPATADHGGDDCLLPLAQDVVEHRVQFLRGVHRAPRVHIDPDQRGIGAAARRAGRRRPARSRSGSYWPTSLVPRATTQRSGPAGGDRAGRLHAGPQIAERLA